MTDKLAAWHCEGVPFQIWLTSQTCEILDVPFAMNVGWASNRDECARQIIYKTAGQPEADAINHLTRVGDDFFRQTGLLIDIDGKDDREGA